MRYYDLMFSGGKLAEPLHYTSQVNGKDDPGALDIEFDIQALTVNDVGQAAHVEVWGIPLKTISQGTDLSNANITLSAGFSGGLPLENSGQKGQIANGQVFQAWGNWIGSEMTLEAIFYGTTNATITNPANISFLWKKGSSLQDDINSALQTAFPAYTVDANITATLPIPEDTPGQYTTLQQFAAWLQQFSQGLNSDKTYQGIRMAVSGTTITVQDQAPPGMGNEVDIKFTELIGQPVWIDAQTIQVICPLRSDINVFTTITMPQTRVQHTAAENTLQAADQAAFQGKFQVISVQHKGRFRDPQGLGWITVINAISSSAPPTQEPGESETDD